MAKGGFPGMGGNMNSLMKQAQKFQKQMEDMQKDLGDKKFESSVGGGAVTAVANGKRQLIEIKIKPEVVDPDDIEMLEDLIMSACNEALKKAEDESSNEMGKLTGGMNMPGMF
ncbi:YbaB/EbfC family nucleoid-associated protein [Clostridium lacusfryxellense]|uniref:YbaB/EbfC family nucleoid-associated protein n=1 Tax=Clostridium lacusfryxellense TaxID=205328 RepID=UPI001C0E488B|nr:YbaB/EbfC family nucleoid-associated protein [Clostridium lacusfryxellense]MBU3114021.1 YbaB/EbfC family nucleoid-associated protein [Clostridium lacusfryxellense]